MLLRSLKRVSAQVMLLLLDCFLLLHAIVVNHHVLVLTDDVVVLLDGELGDLATFQHRALDVFDFTHDLPQFLAAVSLLVVLSSVS